MQVTGFYYLRNQSHSTEVTLWLTQDSSCEQVRIYNGDELLVQFDQYRQGQQISGLPVELVFIDGSRFVPHNSAHRWPSESTWDRLLERIEKHKTAVLGCVLASAALAWLLFFKIIPASAAVVARSLPDSVVHAASEQTLKALEYVYLEPTNLDDAQQTHIRTLWQNHIAKMDQAPEHLVLHFYSAPEIGANAFALPDGQVVLTDELALILKDNDTALLAVLLHEIGHVHHQHGLTLAAQSAGSSVTLALMFGDLEGFAEIIMGTGSALIQQQFSRDMERQADTFALEQLSQLGYHRSAFAEAMQALAQAHGMDERQQDSLWDYLSSHPAISERIERANNTTD
ncbi:M48 family metallopeptidase [Pseudoalteromonas sp. T1lg75]|uniref:M48 family metallopeptidase n=1 Tax=Pseudoalteromonas sp. T1lg75 TaxID=2077102 RepID=UPI000CF6BD85|nr:M48 family metallopeptidase [Pseudoalteromonas sp. T1lg75]